MKKEPKKKTETSKKVLFVIVMLFIFELVTSLIWSWYDKDTTIFCYSIPATAGLCGAEVVSYCNKAKMENISKGIVRLIAVKTKLKEHLPPEVYAQFEEEVNILEDTMYNKVKDTASEAINKDIEIQTY